MCSGFSRQELPDAVTGLGTFGAVGTQGLNQRQPKRKASRNDLLSRTQKCCLLRPDSLSPADPMFFAL